MNHEILRQPRMVPLANCYREEIRPLYVAHVSKSIDRGFGDDLIQATI